MLFCENCRASLLNNFQATGSRSLCEQQQAPGSLVQTPHTCTIARFKPCTRHSHSFELLSSSAPVCTDVAAVGRTLFSFSGADCGIPSKAHHVFPDCTGINQRHGGTCTPHCDVGYFGTPSAYCTFTGTWYFGGSCSPGMPLCALEQTEGISHMMQVVSGLTQRPLLTAFSSQPCSAFPLFSMPVQTSSPHTRD